MRNKRANDVFLLRKFINEILIKEDGGQYSGGGDGGGGTGAGIGGSWTGADASGLSKTFLKPFTDVIATAAGKTKELARRGVTVLQVAFETIGTTLFPFLTDSYDEIFKNEKSEIASIRSEYKGVYDATNKSLLSNDAIALAFFAYPGAVLTGKVAKEAPGVAANLLSIATGGVSDKYVEKTTKSPESGKTKKENLKRVGVRILKEEDEKKLEDIVSDKKAVFDALKRSPIATSTARKAQEIHKKSLQSLAKQIETVLNANSIEDLEKIMGKSLKNSGEIKKEEEKNPDLIKKQFLEIKKRVRQFYAKKIKEERISPVLKQFGEDHPFVRDYKEILEKIES